MQYFIKNIFFFTCFTLTVHASSTTLQARNKKPDSFLLFARQETYNQSCKFMTEARANTCKSSLPNATVLLEALLPTKSDNDFILNFLKESNLPQQLANKPLASKHIEQIITEAVEDYNPRFRRNNTLTNTQYQKLLHLIPSIVARATKSRTA